MRRHLRKTWWTKLGSTPSYWEDGALAEDASGSWLGGRPSPEVAEFIFARISAGVILDAGCGPMSWGALLGSAPRRYVGLDFSRKLLEVGRRAIPSLPAIQAEISSLPIRHSSLNAYLSLGVLEHNQAGLLGPLAEARRVLQPGGRLFISVPLYNWTRIVLQPWVSLKSRMVMSARLRRLLGRKPPPVLMFYQYAFTCRELRQILAAAGFSELEFLPFDFQYGLKRDSNLLRRIDTRIPTLYQAIERFCRWVSPYSCAHMLLIAAQANPEGGADALE